MAAASKKHLKSQRFQFLIRPTVKKSFKKGALIYHVFTKIEISFCSCAQTKHLLVQNITEYKDKRVMHIEKAGV